MDYIHFKKNQMLHNVIVKNFIEELLFNRIIWSFEYKYDSQIELDKFLWPAW